jgi:phosphoenolpyruvate carboxykinase (GTP)
VAAAFPSACGKTNLCDADSSRFMPGWKVFTVGDDIAWLQPGPDGRLWAINPGIGLLWCCTGTNAKTNRNAYEMIQHATHCSPTWR